MSALTAPAPVCPGQRPVCITCLYSSSEESCASEGYQEDCSAMTNVSLLVRRNLYTLVENV